MTEAGGAPSTIPALVAAVRARGEHPAAIGPDGAITTSEALADDARTVAAALVAAGIEPGDRVAIWAPNSIEWIVAVLGLWEAGATLVPVNTRFKGREAAEILARTRARSLVTVTDLLGADPLALLRATDVALPELTTSVVVAGPVPDDAVAWDALLASPTDGDRAEAARRAAAVAPDDVADVLFTSGTTGAPKGVVQTHARTLRVASDWVAMTGLGPDDRYLMVNPYFHMFGLKAGILAALTAGATMIPEPTFDADRALARVATEGVTVLPGAPTLYQALLDHPGRDRHDLSSLRVAVTGAADIPVELIRRLDAELPFETIITGYGLTEGGTASATEPDDDPQTIATTVGRARPGFEIRIVDPDGADVAVGEAGEVVLRGPSVLTHYLDDPGATAACLSPDGWLRTGDLGTLDERGCLRIVGRSKDMFIVGGFNAYPAEIEGALLRHPAVAQAAVIGVPDERLGEVGMAFVVLRPGMSATPEEIVAWSRDEMANYKAPRVVEILDALPLNATGKVVKDELRSRVAP